MWCYLICHARKMTEQKEITPIMFVHSGYSSLASTCRLCNCICEKHHRSNLYAKKNYVLLTIAEELNGKWLPRGHFLHLVCRPCVRRLTNVQMFQEAIRSSLAQFEKTNEKL